VGQSGLASATVPAGDCNDADATIHPGATEVVGDQVDQNCDGHELCYVDADRDGYRDRTATATSSNTLCADPGQLPASAGIDCCDADANVHPGQTAWFEPASSTCGGSYDYDCSSAAEQEFTVYVGAAPTCAPLLGICLGTGLGWSTANTTIPACGTGGLYFVCQLAGSACTGFFARVNQACH